jgi:hypothetical protein
MRPAIPFGMVLGGATLLAVPPLHPVAPFAFGAYGAATVVEALRVSIKHGLTLAPAVVAIFPVLHVSHGVGFGLGLLQYARNPDWREATARVGPRPNGQAAVAAGGGDSA